MTAMTRSKAERMIFTRSNHTVRCKVRNHTGNVIRSHAKDVIGWQVQDTVYAPINRYVNARLRRALGRE